MSVSAIPVIGPKLAEIEAALDFWIARRTFGAQARKLFYRRFAAQTATRSVNGRQTTGRTNIAALQILEQIYTEDGAKPNSVRGRLCAQIRADLANGKRLAAALKDWIPPSERAIIEAGDSAGRIADAFSRTIRMIDKTQEMSSATREAASAVLLVAALVALLVYFSTELIPEIKSLVDPSTLAGPGAALIAISDAVANWYQWAIAGVGVFAGVIWLLLPRLTGPIRSMLDRLPIFAEYRMIAGGKFMVSYATLMDAGKTEVEALEALRPHASPYIAERIEIAINGLGEGVSAAKALLDAKTGFPDPEILYDLASSGAGKASGGAILESVFDWLDIAIVQLRTKFSVLDSVVKMAVTGVAISLVSGIYSIVDTIQQAARSAG